ncbi:MAG TPA: hypothetical protein VNM48_11085, partial [Chloroflexota bacterium]|nr:hypothetical protein [Chloroflexota bacterium]
MTTQAKHAGHAGDTTLLGTPRHLGGHRRRWRSVTAASLLVALVVSLVSAAVTPEANAVSPASAYLVNQDFELGATTWTGWGTGGGSAVIDGAGTAGPPPGPGSKAARLSAASGQVTAISQTVVAWPSGSYVVGGSMKGNSLAGGATAQIRIAFQNSTGTELGTPTVLSTTSGTYAYFQTATLTPPAGTAQVALSLRVTAGTGSADFDAISIAN